MNAEGAAYRLYVGVDIAAENFVAAWLAAGGQPGAPFGSVGSCSDVVTYCTGNDGAGGVGE
jgi:hypothetical protein